MGRQCGAINIRDASDCGKDQRANLKVESAKISE